MQIHKMNIEKSISLERVGKIIIFLLLIFYYGYRIINGMANKTFQSDFKTYYFAGKFYNKEVCPYKSLYEIPSIPSFFYPPFTLPLFSLISKIPFDIAFYLWFFFKCALLTLLIFIWIRKFINNQIDWTFYILCILGFDRAIYMDLICGNVSIIEQFFIWLGFCFYLKRKYFLFCIFIIIASICKITPILFLFLLLLTKEKNKWKYFFTSIILFIGMFGISYLINPILFTEFGYMIQLLSQKDSRYSLTLDGVFFPRYYQIAYFILSAAVIFITYRTYITLNSINIKYKEKIIVFLFCVSYLLVIPRVMHYSFVPFIVPTFFILKTFTPSYLKYVILILASISSGRIVGTLQLQGWQKVFLLNYYNLIIGYVVWGLYLYKIFKRE